jgi:hypothetical protein
VDELIKIHRVIQISLDKGYYGDVTMLARVAGILKAAYHEGQEKGNIRSNSNGNQPLD